jgi:hypothetical protein
MPARRSNLGAELIVELLIAAFIASLSSGIWWIILLAVLGGSLLYWQLKRHRTPARRRREGGLCERCGYDLRASYLRCPECGHTISPAAEHWLQKLHSGRSYAPSPADCTHDGHG